MKNNKDANTEVIARSTNEFGKRLLKNLNPNLHGEQMENIGKSKRIDFATICENCKKEQPKSIFRGFKNF